MKIKNISLKISALVVAGVFVLNGCSRGVESSEKVMEKFKEKTTEIKSLDATVVADMKGFGEADKINFNFTANLKADHTEKEKGKFEGDIKLQGNFDGSDKKLDGSAELKWVMVGKELYFSLIDFNSNDPNTALVKTVLDPYKNKWQHLASEMIPEGVKKFQEKNEADLEKGKKIKELFQKTKWFEIGKEYGMENLNGVEVYHYALKLNKEALKEGVREFGQINEKEMTEDELEKATSLFNALSDIEIWIGKKDYLAYKATAVFSSENPAEEIKTNVILTFSANEYNGKIKIEAPEKFEEFNPLLLLMGMQMGNPGLMLPNEGKEENLEEGGSKSE